MLLSAKTIAKHAGVSMICGNFAAENRMYNGNKTTAILPPRGRDAQFLAGSTRTFYHPEHCHLEDNGRIEDGTVENA